MKKICVFIGSRANYGSIKAAIHAIKKHPQLKLRIVVGASALLDKYGEVIELIEQDGFRIDEKVYMIVEGENPITMAKSTGFGLSELATAFQNLKPDIVLVVGDRYEVLAAAIAAVYMNILVAHTMGGEISGSIDESIRHAITKLAHIHFPASEDARKRIIRMGEDPRFVFSVGCPRMDEVKKILKNNAVPEITFHGVGKKIDITKPFLFVSQHPVTTEYGEGKGQIQQTLQAIKTLGIQTIMLWPNSDAGSDDIAQGIRNFREKEKKYNLPLHLFKNLPMQTYFQFMKRTACMIGNSSSIIREGAFVGTPAVLVGSRQQGRRCGANVIRTSYKSGEIISAVRRQIAHGPYPQDPIYGDGNAGKRIAQILSTISPVIQKKITY